MKGRETLTFLLRENEGFPDYSMKTSSAYKVSLSLYHCSLSPLTSHTFSVSVALQCWTNDVSNAQDGGYASVELALSGNSTFVHSVTNSLTNSR